LFCTLSGPELSRVPRTWPLKEPALTVTVLQALTAQFSAQAGAAAKFTYCARTIKKDPFCASKKEDTYGNVWLPEEGASWGVDYRIRCVYFFWRAQLGAWIVQATAAASYHYHYIRP